MTDLSAKFAGLQTQLTNQHSELMNVLNLIRQDVNAIKTSAAATATHTGNTETYALQIAQSNVEIMNRVLAIQSLYEYLTRDASEGLDLISRINYLQARASELNGYVDGLEGLITPMGQQLTDLLDQLTRVRVSVAPNTASSVYTRLNALTGYVNVMYLAMTGNVGTWTGETLMAYMADIKAAGVQDVFANETNGQVLGDILASVNAIQDCACSAPPTDPCADATAWVPVLFSLENTYDVVGGSGETGNTLASGVHRGTCATLSPEMPQGNAGGYFLRYLSGNGVYVRDTFHFCVRNNGTEVVRLAGLTQETTGGTWFVQEWLANPGATIHWEQQGEGACFLIYAPNGRPGDSDVEIGLFGVG